MPDHWLFALLVVGSITYTVTSLVMRLNRWLDDRNDARARNHTRKRRW